MRLKFFKKKKEEKKEDQEVVDEKLEEELENEVEEESKQVREGSQDDTITKIMERLNEIDNRLPRIDVSIENLKKEIDGLRSELQRMDESLKDMMALYELVSAQINPFVGSSKVTALSVERLDAMEKNLSEHEDIMNDVVNDMKLLFRKNLNLKEIVNKVLYEEVITK